MAAPLAVSPDPLTIIVRRHFTDYRFWGMKLLGGRQWLISFAVSKTIRPRSSASSLLLSFSRGSGGFIQPSWYSTTSSSLKMELIDVDCNLWHRDLKTLQGKEVADDDYWNILQEDAIEKAKIVAVLSPSSTVEEARKGLQALSNSPPPLPIKTTVGVHPYHVNDEEVRDLSLEKHRDEMSKLIKENSDHCSAIGECGLDASEGFPPVEDQIPLFRLQVELANEFNLPLFVHERLAFDETMSILEEAKTPVIIHCFTGTKQQCEEYVKKGYYISVSGYILKESNENYQEVVSCLQEGVVPLDKLMIETDAPYMGFPGCRQLYLDHNEEYAASLNSKKRKRLANSVYPNVPSSLPAVLEKVVECYRLNDPNVSTEEVAERTTQNARQFFGL